MSIAITAMAIAMIRLSILSSMKSQVFRSQYIVIWFP